MHILDSVVCIVHYSPDGSSDSAGVVILQSHVSESSIPPIQRQQWIGWDTLALMLQSRSIVFITAVHMLFIQVNVVDTQAKLVSKALLKLHFPSVSS